jgi:hypothetical protein
MFKSLIHAALFAGALAAPTFPLSDGFPSPSADQLKNIQKAALGTLSNRPAPAAGSIVADGITNLQLINLNENSEVAFFTELLQNVTNGVTGYVISDSLMKNFVLETLKAVLAVSDSLTFDSG